MDESRQIELLKNLLRQEVTSFCRGNNAIWKKSISDTLEEIRDHHWQAVFFGGTLRSLLLSRLANNQAGRPRDIDIVTSDATLGDLRSSFEPFVSRQTRFGGLQLKRVNWQFDLWPLKETFALKERGNELPTFADLPTTTFFNIEAIAMEIWPKRGHPRRIFSGDDQFFKGVINRTIEINHEPNPFPNLCVVRAFVMVAKLRWKIGPRLLSYLAEHGSSMTVDDFEKIQEKHYGRVEWPGSHFERTMHEVRESVERKLSRAIPLSLPGQLTLWPEDESYEQRIILRTLRHNR